MSRSGESVHWTEPVVGMRLSEGVLAHFGEEAVTADMEEASAVWASPQSAPIIAVLSSTSTEEPNTDDGINGVYLPEVWTFEPGRLAVTLTTHRVDTGEMQDADVVLNPEYFPAPVNRYVLARVLAHELGHVLGLGESDAPRSTMWPAIPAGSPLREIDDDDRDGLRAIYGEAFRPSYTLCGASSAPGLPTPYWAIPAVALLNRRRRRRLMLR